MIYISKAGIVVPPKKDAPTHRHKNGGKPEYMQYSTMDKFSIDLGEGAELLGSAALTAGKYAALAIGGLLVFFTLEAQLVRSLGTAAYQTAVIEMAELEQVSGSTAVLTVTEQSTLVHRAGWAYASL